VRHVILLVEKERYALPLESVREVFVPPTPSIWSRVPSAPPPIRGVINLRGRVVMVVDLRMLLGIADNQGRADKVVLLERGRRDLALLVTEVEGIESVEKIVAGPGRAGAAVRGIARLRRSAITVLDVEGIDSAVAALFANQVK